LETGKKWGGKSKELKFGKRQARSGGTRVEGWGTSIDSRGGQTASKEVKKGYFKQPTTRRGGGSTEYERREGRKDVAGALDQRSRLT